MADTDINKQLKMADNIGHTNCKDDPKIATNNKKLSYYRREREREREKERERESCSNIALSYGAKSMSIC